MSDKKRCGSPTRSGKPCVNHPKIGKSRCRMHGADSTGPKSEAGKKTVSRNAGKHWLYGSPKRFLEGLDQEVRKLFEDQVDEICKAEEIEDNPLDKELVVSFVTASFIEREARSYLLERGVVTAEEWKAIPVTYEGSGHRDATTDTDGEQIALPVVNTELVRAYGSLVKMKRELHAQLRAHTAKRGDMAPGPAAEARRRLDALFPMRDPDEPPEGAS